MSADPIRQHPHRRAALSHHCRTHARYRGERGLSSAPKYNLETIIQSGVVAVNWAASHSPALTRSSSLVSVGGSAGGSLVVRHHLFQNPHQHRNQVPRAELLTVSTTDPTRVPPVPKANHLHAIHYRPRRPLSILPPSRNHLHRPTERQAHLLRRQSHRRPVPHDQSHAGTYLTTQLSLSPPPWSFFFPSYISRSMPLPSPHPP